MPHPTGGYRNAEGKKVPGCTSVIGHRKDAGGLIWWAFKQGQSHPEASNVYQTTDAAPIGTLAHSMVETHITGDDTEYKELLAEAREELSPEALKARIETATEAYKAYLRWEERSGVEIVATEIEMVSEELQFGGCPDAIFLFDDRLELADWKTSKRVYPDHFIQLAAYGQLWEENRDELAEELGIPNLPFTGYHLLRFGKESADFHHHFWEDVSEGVETFRHLRRVYDLDRQIKKRI